MSVLRAAGAVYNPNYIYLYELLNRLVRFNVIFAVVITIYFLVFHDVIILFVYM